MGGFSLARSTLGIWTQSYEMDLRHDEEHLGSSVAQRWYRFEGSIGHKGDLSCMQIRRLSERLVICSYKSSQASTDICPHSSILLNH